MFGTLVTSYIREQSLVVSKSYVVPQLYLQRLSSQTHRYLFTVTQEPQRIGSSYFLQAIQRHQRPATVRHGLTLLQDKSNCALHFWKEWVRSVKRRPSLLPRRPRRVSVLPILTNLTLCSLHPSGARTFRLAYCWLNLMLRWLLVNPSPWQYSTVLQGSGHEAASAPPSSETRSVTHIDCRLHGHLGGERLRPVSCKKVDLTFLKGLLRLHQDSHASLHCSEATKLAPFTGFFSRTSKRER